MYTLPYSGDIFNIPEISFRDIFKIARWYDTDDDSQVINYLYDILNIHHLNCIDKFFVICKACELHITHTLHMSGKGGAAVDVSLNTILHNLYETTSYVRQYNIGDIEINMDIPRCFFTQDNKDLFSAVIDSIIIEDVEIDFQQLSDENKSRILSSLPANVFNKIKEYLADLDLSLILFEGHARRGIDEIRVNFLGFDPLYIIRSLYSEFPLVTCREIIYFISRKINSETLLNSTPVDVKFYLEEHARENKENSNNSGNMENVI